jgi:hypothetical protein
MAVYEVVLRFPDRDEVRLTDRTIEVGGTLEIEGHGWLVQSEEQNYEGRAAARYICVELRKRSRELRARSSELIGQIEELRDRGAADRP